MDAEEWAVSRVLRLVEECVDGQEYETSLELLADVCALAMMEHFSAGVDDSPPVVLIADMAMRVAERMEEIGEAIGREDLEDDTSAARH